MTRPGARSRAKGADLGPSLFDALEPAEAAAAAPAKIAQQPAEPAETGAALAAAVSDAEPPAETMEPAAPVTATEPSTHDEVIEPAPAPTTGAVPATRTEPLADQGQRDIIRGALDDTILVEAAAGTGKTTELVSRIVALLEAGRAELDRIVAMTFLEVMAGELKLRLREAIERARLDPARPPEARARLNAALPRLEEARIGTIHSFCTDVLREHPVEAGVDPRFEVAADEAQRALFERAFARWFEDQLDHPGDGVRRILRRWKREPLPFRGRGDEGPRGVLRHAAWSLVQYRDFPAAWTGDPAFDRDARIDALLSDLEALAARAPDGDPDDWFTKSLLEIARLVDDVRRSERVRPRDYDALEARLGAAVVGKEGKHWTWRGSRFSAAFPRALRDQRDALHERMRAFAADAGADLAPRLRDELWPVVEAYEAAKARAGCLDFEDLLVRARDLVRDHPGIRRELQRRFTHYFVDEFQDTDPIQAELLLRLAAEEPAPADWRDARIVPGKLFLVGDPKQSIYRFRRADVGLYRDVQDRLLAHGARRVELTVSFRSVPEIQAAVNGAFAPLLGGDAYVPLAPFRPGCDTQPAVIALPVPAPYAPARGGWAPKIFDWCIEESLPDVTAAWIDWLVRESGWTVTDREHPGERVPVEPRHVCLLFKRFRVFFEDATRPYVQALEARNLSHLLVGGSSFHAREEILALRNALAAIERPDDELAVFATLRGPLLALTDAALLAWRERVGSLHPYRTPPDDLTGELAEVRDALAVLRDLHRGRNHRPVADTIERLLETTRAHAALAIWPTGEQALANVGRLMDMARRAEHQGLTSFRGFVDRLAEDAERGEAAEAPLLEQGVDGVRIMTVHKAKGLEFPVVVLADMTAKPTFEQPTRWTDATRGLCAQRLAGCTPPDLRDHAGAETALEQAEAVRVLYVAATRARDVLVVPAIADERNREGWLAPLDPALYPDPLRARAPEQRVAPGCPEFGGDATPGRPAEMARPLGAVMPGLHAPCAGAHRVVWWDPARLALGVRPSIGLAQTRILEADDAGRAERALADWQAWSAARTATRERAGVPTQLVRAATEWTAAVRSVTGAGVDAAITWAARANDVAVVDARADGARSGSGARFGTLVHTLLSLVALDDARSGVAAHAAVHARLLGAPDDERDAAVAAVLAALAHPLARRAAAAADLRRETPLVVRLDDGTLLDSIVDLAFRGDDGWTVLDWKTDAELDARADRYRLQVALYVHGIAAASGLPAKGFLVRV